MSGAAARTGSLEKINRKKILKKEVRGFVKNETNLMTWNTKGI